MRHFFFFFGLTSVLACARVDLETTPEPHKTFTDGETPLPGAEKTSQEELSALTQGNNQFAFDYYQKLSAKNKDKNLFFSPASLSIALAMTYAGANGKTAEEMAAALRFPLPPEKLHQAFSSTLEQWSGAKD